MMFLIRCWCWLLAIHSPTSFMKIDVRLTDISLSRKLISFSLLDKTGWIPSMVYQYRVNIDHIIVSGSHFDLLVFSTHRSCNLYLFHIITVRTYGLLMGRWKRSGMEWLFLFSKKWIVMLYAWFRNYDNSLWNRDVADSCVSLKEGNCEFKG